MGCRVHSIHLLFHILPGFLWTHLSVSWPRQSCGPDMGGRHVSTRHLCTFHLHSCWWILDLVWSLICFTSQDTVKAQVARWPSLYPCYWIDTWITVKPRGSFPAVAANLLVFTACAPWLKSHGGRTQAVGGKKGVTHLHYFYSKFIHKGDFLKQTLLGLWIPLIKFQSGNQITGFEYPASCYSCFLTSGFVSLLAPSWGKLELYYNFFMLYDL